MTEILTTPQGAFTVELAGPPGGAVVVLLHGFPQSRHSWREQLPALAQAGFRAVAPDQRGYSPGVRPAPSELSAYAIERLVGDAIELADAAGARGQRFHLVGHDWGGQVAWYTAARHPERIASLAVLSRPHPDAFRRAYRDNLDGQADRSNHHRAFLDPATAQLLLSDDARRLRQRLGDQGVPSASIDDYLSVVGTPAALEAALAWYRQAAATAATTGELGKISVPTLYLWGDADGTVGPSAARTTADYVAAPYRFEPIPGVGHFVTDQVPALVNQHLLAHLAAHPS
jgi:pimeloyl-ACP methyl ester carboxylesterase